MDTERCTALNHTDFSWMKSLAFKCNFFIKLVAITIPLIVGPAIGRGELRLLVAEATDPYIEKVEWST